MTCLLCSETADFYFEETPSKRRYFHCANCDLRFLDPAHHLNETDERHRYDLHENDMNDSRYRNYLTPIADWVKENSGGDGLDFGCGKAPLLAELLQQRGCHMQVYDPYFFPDLSYREQSYDFCVAVEAIEHFYYPLKEIEQLTKLLKVNGSLGFVTQLFQDETNFSTWYYRLDPSHVCFFSKKTFAWIQSKFGFKRLHISGKRFIWLSLQ